MNRSELLKKFGKGIDNLLDILHAIQKNNDSNYLNKDDMKEVADYLNTSFSHVYGVATYYSMFSTSARGRNIIRVCNSPLCNMERSTELINRLKDILAIEVGETTSDNRFTLELSECLGICETAPGMMINEDTFGDTAVENVASILEKYN